MRHAADHVAPSMKEQMMATDVLMVGSVISERYRIERCLGLGRLGTAYVASDLQDGRSQIALKTLALIRSGVNGRGIQLLREELSRLSLIRHPNLVRILDYGLLDDGRTPYLVQEFVRGQHVLHASQDSEIGSQVRLLVRLCHIIQYLHARGIVHRNIKSSNVLVTDQTAAPGKIMVSDYGLGAWMTGIGQSPSSASVAWMAPEVVMGHPASVRSDLYSLGVLAYLIFARHLPFDDEDSGYLIQKQLQGSPDFKPIERLPSGPGLAQVLRSLLDKDPDRRPSSAEEVIRLLRVATARDYVEDSADVTESYFSSARFVGRDREMKVLRERAAAVRSSGRGWAFYVAGEAGSGKTRCMEELRTWALLEGWRVFEAGCIPTEDNPYGPFRRFLQWTDSLYPPAGDGRTSEEIFQSNDYQRLREAGPVDLDAESAMGQFRDLITREIVRRISERPTLFLLHDFHLADEATAAVLGYLASDIAAHPVLLVVGYRTGEEQSSRLSRVIEQSQRQMLGGSLVLDSLGAEDVEQMIRSMAGKDDLPDGVIRRVLDSSGGNPFFVEELLKHLVERGLLRKVQGCWHWRSGAPEELEVPASLAAVVGCRWGQLADSAKEVTRWLAVIGRAAPERLIEAAAGLASADFAGGLKELEAKQIIRAIEEGGGGIIEFRHSLIAEVIRSGLAEEVRGRMHARVGEILEDGADAEGRLLELATHFTQGRCGEKAVQYALRAAATCRAEYSNEAALRFYEYVLAHHESLPLEQRCQVALDAADACCILGNPKQALQILQPFVQSIKRSGSTILKLMLHSRLSRVYQFLGRSSLMRQVAAGGLRLIKTAGIRDDQVRDIKAWLLSQLAFGTLKQSNPSLGLSLLEEALECAKNPLLVGHLQILMAGLNWIGGDFRRGVQVSRHAIKLLESLNAHHLLPAAYSHAGINIAAMGKFREAIRYHEMASSTAKKTRSRYSHVQALCNLAEAYCRSGSFEMSLHLTGEIERAAKETRNQALVVSCHLFRIELDLALSSYSSASDKLRSITDDDLVEVPAYLKAQTLFCAAWLYVELGDWHAALTVLRKLDEMSADGGPIFEAELGLILEARVFAHLSQLDRAINLAMQAEKSAKRKHLTHHRCTSFLWLAEFLLLKNRIIESERYSRWALRLALAMPAFQLEAHARLLIGKAALHRIAATSEVGNNAGGCLSNSQMQEAARAESELTAAINISQKCGLNDICWQAHFEMSRLEDLRQDYNKAFFHACATLEIVRRLHQCVPLDLRDSYCKANDVASVSHTCEELIRRCSHISISQGLALEQIKEQNLRTLVRMSSVINAVRELVPLLKIIVDLFIGATQYERIFLFLHNDESESMLLFQARNSDGQELAQPEELCLFLVEEVRSRGVPFIAGDVNNDPRLSPLTGSTTLKSGSVFCAPLKVWGRLLGVIYAERDGPEDYISDASISFMATFCNLAAVAIDNAITHGSLRQEKNDLGRSLKLALEGFGEMIGKSAAMQQLREKIALVAPSPLDVLIYGESGTGKELVARALHRLGRRSSASFVSLDCGSLVDTLAESELFGYRKGAFTGANENRAGLLETAHGGIIFLDEISNLPMRLQRKFLRVLQEREVRRIGEATPRKIDIQIIAATNKNLREEIRKGRFRKDLFYRLNAVEITVPALRERIEDIPLLIDWFLARAIRTVGGRSKIFSPQANRLLLEYSYPGNVRELMHIVESCYYLARDRIIDVRDLPAEMQNHEKKDKAKSGPDARARLIWKQIRRGTGTFHDSVKTPFIERKIDASIVRRVIHRALLESKGKYRDAFRILGVPAPEYPSLIQFLKRNGCYLDFRAYRSTDPSRRPRKPPD